MINCRVSKNTQSTQVIRDTVIRVDTVEKLRSIINTISTPLNSDGVYVRPCDTFGKLRPIYITANTGKAKVKIWTSGDSLKYSIIIDSIQSVLDSTKERISSLQKQVHEDKSTKKETIIKYRVHWKLAIAIFVAGLLIGAGVIRYLKTLVPTKLV